MIIKEDGFAGPGNRLIKVFMGCNKSKHKEDTLAARPIMLKEPKLEDAFYQVLYKWGSPVFADEHSGTFLSICRKLAVPTLGLDLVYIFTHVWPIKARSLKSAVKADLSIGFTSLLMYFFQLSLGLLLPHTSGQDPLGILRYSSPLTKA
ncbi:uncharacterized protein LOC112030129 isoform X1 [Quercus suber]|uniref:uncharacterized protein LOC112030129 isoform X1 n=1 Tax=Quercus suber TaxID=58331 RepID=UPI0032DE2C04